MSIIQEFKKTFLFLFINLYYSYALSFGYANADDFKLLSSRLSDLPKLLTVDHFRPLHYLSYQITGLLSDSAFFQRFLSLVLLNICLYLCYRIVRGRQIALLLLLAIAIHPAMIYPVTWIAQRTDLILLAFVLLMFLNLDNPKSYLYMFLSNLSKSPFVFQNLLVVIYALRKKHKYIAAVTLLLMAGLIAIGFLYVYQVNFKGAQSAAGLYRLQYTGIASLIFSFLARLAKLIEGIITIYVPFSAVYNTPFFGLVTIGYIITWIGLAGITIKNKAWSWDKTSKDMLALAILMAIPLAFGTNLRVIAPVIPFFYMATFLPLDRQKFIKPCLAAIIFLNLLGSVNSYHLSNTGCYDLKAGYSSQCALTNIPAEQWGKDRQNVINNFVDRVQKVL